jgi:hypothetical protein
MLIARVLNFLLQSSTSKSLETDSLEECDTIQQVCPDNVSLKYGSGSVMKRHSAGEVTDRGQRTKSLILQTEHRYERSRKTYVIIYYASRIVELKCFY